MQIVGEEEDPDKASTLRLGKGAAVMVIVFLPIQEVKGSVP
jgi:hypothetical protein